MDTQVEYVMDEEVKLGSGDAGDTGGSRDGDKGKKDKGKKDKGKKDKGKNKKKKRRGLLSQTLNEDDWNKPIDLKITDTLKKAVQKYMDDGTIPQVYLSHLIELERRFVEEKGFTNGIQTTDKNNEKCYNNVKTARHPGNYLMSFNVMSYGNGMPFFDTTRARFTRQQKNMLFCKASQIPELKRILKTTTTTEDKSVLYQDCLNAAQKQFPEDSIEELRGPYFPGHNTPDFPLPNGCSHRRGSKYAYYSRSKNEDFHTSYEHVTG